MVNKHWTQALHHDGSALYVSNPLPAFDETVTVWLRAPLDAPVNIALLRTFIDGENQLQRMEIARRDDTSAWWAAEMKCVMPSNPYHFKLLTDTGAYYYKANGVSRAHSPDFFDFKLLAGYAAPSWVHEAVFYQIFPDRFYNGDPANDVPPGAWGRLGYTTSHPEWGTPPQPWKEAGNLDFYGGDLTGIAQKVDYLRDLGVNALYLTPIFASRTNHRYDIIDFDQIDPYLGGNEALVELREALDAAEMRLILDVTPNHTSYQHHWFTAARESADAPSADFYTFYERPDVYEAWMGDNLLPKLNYRSEALRAAMYSAPDAVLRRWLRAPYRIDGWRFDVQNMVARHGLMQQGNKIGRGMRRAIKGDNPQAYMMGENFHDASSHLQGNELDAIMNYQGFTMPLRRWLGGYDYGAEWIPDLTDKTLLPAEAMVEQWQHFRASIPWTIATQQFNQLDSHDIVRIVWVVKGDMALAKLAAVMLMTYVGVPCLYYGDEIGMDGGPDPDNRRCMPWDEGDWNLDMRQFYQHIIRLRKESSALKYGGYQTLLAEGGLVAFQRQSPEQRLIVVGHRGPEALTEAAIPVWQAALGDGSKLVDRLSGAEYVVEDGALHVGRLERGAALVLEAV